MFTIRKRSKEMCIGHRLINYSGMCANVHGHGITVELTLQSDEVADTGITVDFHRVGHFLNRLDGLWDHGFLVNPEDSQMYNFLRDVHSKMYVMAGKRNPTMENLAKEVYELAKAEEWSDFITQVTVYEKGGVDNVSTYEP